MHAATIKNGTSYVLITLCAVIVGARLPGFLASLSVGAFLRSVLFPVAALMVLVVAVHRSEQRWPIIRPKRADVIAIVLLAPASTLLAILIARFGISLNLISVPALCLVITCYSLSLYFMIIGEEHYALALFLLTLPVVDFVEWDLGLRWRLTAFQIGDISLSVTGENIYVTSLFGTWITSRLARKQLQLTEPWRYVTPALLLFYTLLSFFLFTNTANQGPALNHTATVLVFPLLVYVMMVEAIDTKDKFYLMISCLIAMVVMYVSLAFYMSYRTMPITFAPSELMSNNDSVRYGTGSQSLKGIELALITPLLLGLLVTVRKVRYALLIGGLTAYVAVGQLLSFSRSALLATLAGVACLVGRKRIQLFAIIGLFTTVAFWTPIYDYGLARFHSIGSLDNLNLRDLSYSRYQGWTAATAMLRHEPVFGVGLNNFGDVAPRFSSPYSGSSPDGELVPMYMSDAHNLFLHVGAEMGLLGLGILLLLLGILLFDLLRGMFAAKATTLEPLGWALFGVYVANIVISTFGAGFWAAKSSLGHNVLYWTLFALMARLRWVANRMSCTESAP